MRSAEPWPKFRGATKKTTCDGQDEVVRKMQATNRSVDKDVATFFFTVSLHREPPLVRATSPVHEQVFFLSVSA